MDGGTLKTESSLIATARGVALTLALLALWSITHVYKGITGDAELYAVQALSRLEPWLAGDLYLRYVNQDRFTVFSPLYALCIRALGLHGAALSLTLTFTSAFLIAAWALARRLTTPGTAFLSVAGVMLIKGTYGSWGIFGYAETWLTARGVAEALVVAALACHYRGWQTTALLIAAAALPLHPIMALPGVLVLLCVRLPLKTGLLAGALVTFIVLAVAVGSRWHPLHSGPFVVMDPSWLKVVEERSQFLFLQYWTLDDWEINTRPFLYLTLSALALDFRCRRLCVAAMTVGGVGITIAAIAALVAPLALVLQGQAWRWEWITCFASVLLLAPTAQTVYRDPGVGPLCALLLVLGWTFSVIDPLVCIGLTLLLWQVRHRLSDNSGRYLRWAAGALAAVVALWTIATAWSTLTAPSPETGRDSLVIADLRNLVGLGATGVLIVYAAYRVIARSRSLAVLGLSAATCAATAAFALPGALSDVSHNGSSKDFAEFADWRARIPPSSNVFVEPAHNSAALAWFTLGRPSYLTVNQSAGVVFSRATALEVERRSEVLEPVQDPDWRLLSKNRRTSASKDDEKASHRPLTAQSLAALCRDPVLDFVIAKEKAGSAAAVHVEAGDWKDFSLYDCRAQRAAVPTTGPAP